MFLCVESRMYQDHFSCLIGMSISKTRFELCMEKVVTIKSTYFIKTIQLSIYDARGAKFPDKFGNLDFSNPPDVVISINPFKVKFPFWISIFHYSQYALFLGI